MSISLTLDIRLPDGSKLPGGSEISLKYDRTVRTTDGVTPLPALKTYHVQGSADVVATIPYAADDPAIAEESQGFGIIVRASWKQRYENSTWERLVIVKVEDGTALSLSDLEDAIPVPVSSVTVNPSQVIQAIDDSAEALSTANEALQTAQTSVAPTNDQIDTHLGGDSTGILQPSGPYTALTADILNLVQGAGAFGALKGAMDAINRDDSPMHVAVQVLSDSTGVGTDFWPYLFAQWIATKCPTANVRVRNWDFNNGTPAPGQNTRYEPPTLVQQVGDVPSQRCSQTKKQAARYPFDGNEISDIDFAIKFRRSSWPPTGTDTLIAKTGAGGNLGYHLFLDSNVTTTGPTLRISPDGTAYSNYRPGAPFTVTANEWTWLRVTANMTTSEIKFWTSSDGSGAPASWVQLGTTTTTSYTTLNTATGQDWQAGGAQLGNSTTPGPGSQFLTGDIAEIWVRESIDGPTLLPISPHDWINYGSPSYNGGSLIDVVIGAWGTKGIDTLGTSPVRELMTPMLPTVLTIFNDSHNDGSSAGPTYLAQWDEWLQAVQARLPLSSIAITGQNPRTPPAGSRVGHDLRHSQLAAWASKNQATFLDVYASFLADPRWDGTNTSVLMNADGLGVHPSPLGMQECWLPVVTRATETGA